MDRQLVAELRKQFDELHEELDANGFCTRRECMCDTAAPVVKINDLIAKLEQEVS